MGVLAVHARQWRLRDGRRLVAIERYVSAVSMLISLRTFGVFGASYTVLRTVMRTVVRAAVRCVREAPRASIDVSFLLSSGRVCGPVRSLSFCLALRTENVVRTHRGARRARPRRAPVTPCSRTRPLAGLASRLSARCSESESATLIVDETARVPASTIVLKQRTEALGAWVVRSHEVRLPSRRPVLRARFRGGRARVAE